MLSGISITDYRERLSELNDKYDEQQEVAKQAYKDANDYKIAWNWSNQPEHNRIERNRAQAIYRLRRRYDNSFLDDLRNGINGEFNSTGMLNAGPYWENGSSYYVDRAEQVEATGVNLVFGIWDSESGQQLSYRSGIQREFAIRRIIRQCGKWQAIDGDSFRPYIELLYGLVKQFNIVYLNMAVYR